MNGEFIAFLILLIIGSSYVGTSITQWYFFKKDHLNKVNTPFIHYELMVAAHPYKRNLFSKLFSRNYMELGITETHFYLWTHAFGFGLANRFKLIKAVEFNQIQEIQEDGPKLSVIFKNKAQDITLFVQNGKDLKNLVLSKMK